VKNLTWQNPEQLFVAQVLTNKVKSKCCGIKVVKETKRCNSAKSTLFVQRKDYFSGCGHSALIE
jgi:hypothetical protein